MRKTESKNQGETFIDSFVEDRTLVVLVHWLYSSHRKCSELYINFGVIWHFELSCSYLVDNWKCWNLTLVKCTYTVSGKKRPP